MHLGAVYACQNDKTERLNASLFCFGFFFSFFFGNFQGAKASCVQNLQRQLHNRISKEFNIQNHREDLSAAVCCTEAYKRAPPS